jgi:hypothetical protein
VRGALFYASIIHEPPSRLKRKDLTVRTRCAYTPVMVKLPENVRGYFVEMGRKGGKKGGKKGAQAVNSKLTTEKRSQAAKKAWATKRKRSR